MKKIVDNAKKILEQTVRDLENAREWNELKDLWDYLYPEDQEKLLNEALQEGNSLDLTAALSETQQKEFYARISNYLLGEHLKGNPKTIGAILQKLSPERKKAFFCCLSEESRIVSYEVFMAIKGRDLKQELIRENPEMVKAYIENLEDQKAENFIRELSECFKDDIAFQNYLVQRILELQPPMVAKVIEKAYVDFAYAIVNQVKAEKIWEVCISFEDMFFALKKTNFKFLERQTWLPLECLNDGEKREIFRKIDERKIDLKEVFSLYNIANLFLVLEDKDKVKLLRSFSKMEDYMSMYSALSPIGQNSMLEVLYQNPEENFTSILSFILSNKEDLDFWEQLLFDKLKEEADF